MVSFNLSKLIGVKLKGVLIDLRNRFLLQFYKCGEIMKSYDDDKQFPIDFDLKGNLYHLNSNADNMSRSTVLYHPSILSEKKRAVI